ncbi:MAG: hypothetical protein AAGN82_01870 [Myxococcota bacterium]
MKRRFECVALVAMATACSSAVTYPFQDARNGGGADVGLGLASLDAEPSSAPPRVQDPEPEGGVVDATPPGSATRSLPWGRYRIEGAIRGPVYAWTEDEIAGFIGTDIVITSGGLTSPWLTCQNTAWDASDVEVAAGFDAEPADHRLPEERALIEALRTEHEGERTWRASCDGVVAGFVQHIGAGVVITHWDGVAFVARRQPRDSPRTGEGRK